MCNDFTTPGINKYSQKNTVVVPVVTEITDPTENQRKYLNRRAFAILWDRQSALRQQYKITFDYKPKTAKEALKRIQDGLFTIEGADKKDDVKFYYIEDAFTWRGPDDQPDRIGFDAANKKLLDEIKKITDAIEILDPKDALVLVQAFEAA